MNVNVVLLVMSVLLGLLFVGLGVPLIRRQVPPNGWYGLRVPATLRDESVWYEANAWTGKAMLQVGVAIAVIGVVLSVLDVAVWTKVLGWAVVVEVGVIGMVIRGWRLANQLLERKQNQDRRA